MKEPDFHPDDSDSEEELLAAAANWAGATTSTTTTIADIDAVSSNPSHDDRGTNRKKPQTANLGLSGSRRKRESSWSLHVTQLSYDASDYDIRTLFSAKGCLVSSVRLVYDHRDEKGKQKFRGVAFVDVADEESFQRGLGLHRTKHLGRSINVRPVKSREELSQIVVATQAKVSAILQNASVNSSSKSPAQSTKQETTTQAVDADNSNTKKPATKHDKKARKPKDKGSKKSSKSATKKAPYRKPTKRDRSKRAAIIAAKVVKKRK